MIRQHLEQAKQSPGDQSLKEQRDNPGMSTGGSGGAGARKPAAGSRTDDRAVGDRQRSQPQGKS